MGIQLSDYVRTMVYHFADGGRHLSEGSFGEESEAIKADEGLWSLIRMNDMPGSDAIGTSI